MTKEALTLALEALESERMYFWNSPERIEKAITAIKAALEAHKALGSPNGEAQPEQEPVAWWIPKAEQFCLPSSDGTRPFAKAWEPLYTTPPQPKEPKQEPHGLAAYVIGCFIAAEAEGLQEALAETTDERLKDLVERRLMHALYAAQNITPPQRKPLTNEYLRRVIYKHTKLNPNLRDDQELIGYIINVIDIVISEVPRCVCNVKPLTDEDLDLICEKALFCRISFQQFARSIEAAHGIKGDA